MIFKNKFSTKKLPGYTLAELMVVLVIIGILLLIALPLYDDLFGDAYSIEAQNQLKYLESRQQSYYQKHFKYAMDFSKIGFSQPRTISEDGDARYFYEIINAGQSSFIARATAVADFDNDGKLNIWEIDQEGVLREVVPD